MGSRLIILAAAISMVLISTGCRRGMAESQESSGPLPNNALEAANMWPGARTDFISQGDGPVMKLRQRRTGFKVFDAKRRPVALVLARGEQIDLVPLSDGKGRVLLRDDAAKKKIEAVADDPGPSVVYTLFEAREDVVDSSIGDEETSDGPSAHLDADRNKPLLRVVAFKLDDGRRSWRVLDPAGKRLADLVPYGDVETADSWLFGEGSAEGDLKVELLPTKGAVRGIEARTKGTVDEGGRIFWAPRSKMPASVLAPLLVKIDDVATKAVLMQLFRCDGLASCRERATVAAAPSESAPKDL